jgi:purine nucleosidase
MPTRIVLDTDLGTDVDDCLALATVLASPELQLEGVTCVYGDVAVRARMARRLLELAGRAEVPVLTGASEPLLGLRPVYWEGHEGEGLIADDDPPPMRGAVAFLIETALASPGAIHILAVGPLTNVALALRAEPRLAAALAGLTIMGGVMRGPGQWAQPYAEHNIRCDPEAAHIVLSAGVPITLVPLDVTTQVRIGPADVARIRTGGGPFRQAVAEQIDRYPSYRRRGYTFLHDPLAAAVMVDPSLVTLEPLQVEVELGGRLAAGATLVRAPDPAGPPPAQVAVAVERERAERFVVGRIAGGEASA